MILYFNNGADHRCINTATQSCLYKFKGFWCIARLGCATTYAARLVEAGWRLISVDVGDGTG